MLSPAYHLTSLSSESLCGHGGLSWSPLVPVASPSTVHLPQPSLSSSSTAQKGTATRTRGCHLSSLMPQSGARHSSLAREGIETLAGAAPARWPAFPEGRAARRGLRLIRHSRPPQALRRMLGALRGARRSGSRRRIGWPRSVESCQTGGRSGTRLCTTRPTRSTVCGGTEDPISPSWGADITPARCALGILWVSNALCRRSAILCRCIVTTAELSEPVAHLVHIANRDLQYITVKLVE